MATHRPAHRRGTTGRPYRRFRRQIINASDLCCLCGGELRRDVPPTHPLAPSLEHHGPLSLGGTNLDPTNAGVAHLGCNSSRGNGTKRSHRTRLHTSEHW